MVNRSGILQHSRLVKEENDFSYRDLNKNGKLDIYEDPRQPLEARVEDLISQMTLEEKVGTPLAKYARKVNCLLSCRRPWRPFISKRPMFPMIQRIPFTHLVLGCLIDH